MKLVKVNARRVIWNEVAVRVNMDLWHQVAAAAMSTHPTKAIRFSLNLYFSTGPDEAD